MKSGLRTTCIMIIFFAAVFSGSGCANRRPPVAESAASPAAPSLSQQEMKKIVVARVNGAEIYMDALNRMMNIMSANTPTASSPVSRDELRKKALDQLVLRELALQEAKSQGLSVEGKDVDHAMDNLIMSLGHDEGFQAYLEKENTTGPEVREQVEKSLLLQLLFNKEVLKKATVSDDDVQAYYESRKKEFLTPEKQMSFEEAKDVIEKRLKAIAQAKRIGEWEQELKKNANVELVDTPGQQVQKKP
jgi:hypothetical protein